MKFKLPALTRRPLFTLLVLMGCLSLLLSACKIDPQAAARISIRMEATRRAGQPTETPAPPTPFLALCIVKANTRLPLREAPDQTAKAVGTVANKDVLSATLRSEDNLWVYGTNLQRAQGWLPAASVGCTVPVAELVPPTRTPSAASIATQTAEALLPTKTAAPTGTATEVPTAAPPKTPTLTLVPPTATPLVQFELNCTPRITNGLNVRRGPGTTFPAFIKLNEGEPFIAVGRSADGQWIGGRLPKANQAGWVIGASLACEGDIASLAILQDNVLPQAAATAVPSTPTAIATATLEPTVAPATSIPTPVITVAPTITATTQPTKPVATTAPTLALPANGIQCTVFVTTGVNVRSGPARTFAVQGVAITGEAFVASGRTANNQWLLGTSQQGFTGWVITGGMKCAKPIRSLPVTNAPAAPAKPVATPTPKGSNLKNQIRI